MSGAGWWWWTVAMVAALQGCSASGKSMRGEMQERHATSNQDIDRTLEQGRASADAARVQQGGEVSALPWVATQRIPRREEGADFLARAASIHQAYPTPVGQVLAQMKSIIGKAAERPIDVQVEPDAFETSDAAAKASSTSLPPPPAAGAGSADMAALQSILLAGAGSQGSARGDRTLNLSYKGSIEGMLDAAAINLGLRWRWDAGASRVVFYRYVTREWHIAMIPGSATSSASLSSEGGTESSAGSGATQTRFNGDSSVWKALESAVKVAMGPGGRMSVTEATSMLVVRDTPEAIERVDEIVGRINAAFRYQVTVDVRIFRVQGNERDLRGVNWKALFRSVGLNLNADTSNLAASADTGLSSIVLSVNPTAQGDLRPFVGSQAVVDSLSQLGEISTVTNATVKTVNNQPAPVRVGRRISYLKSVTNTAVASVGTSASLTPGFVDTGLTLSILPTVQEGGRDLLMQVLLTLAELNGITEFSSGGAKAQFPDVSSRDFLQRTWLRSGETLLLFGFESMNEFVKNDGVVHHSLWGLGGRSDADARKESLVVMLTPVVTSIRQGVR